MEERISDLEIETKINAAHFKGYITGFLTAAILFAPLFILLTAVVRHIK